MKTGYLFNSFGPENLQKQTTGLFFLQYSGYNTLKYNSYNIYIQYSTYNTYIQYSTCIKLHTIC